MYKVSYLGNKYYPAWEMELSYEEMVEIFYGFLNSPLEGNEYYQDARAKAFTISEKLPATDY